MLWTNAFADTREDSAGMVGWAWGEMLLWKMCQSESLTDLLSLQAQSVEMGCPGEAGCRFYRQTPEKRWSLHP